jgi:hypothetical protein
MITMGLSQHEINLITKILDEHKVEYHVDAAGGSQDGQEAKVKAGRGDASFYQIDIHDGQLGLLPANAKSKLEGLGIYPEMEAPDFSEEIPKDQKLIDPIKSQQRLKKIERAFIVMMLLGIALFIKRIME